MIKRVFWPDIYCESVMDIDFKKIYKSGFRGLIFDIDNTIVGYDNFEIKKEIFDLFIELEGIGFKICLVSNSFKKRVVYFENVFNIKSFNTALKPLPFGIMKGIKYLGVPKNKIVMIGDQIFTDVICARLNSIFVVLVEPIKERIEFVNRFKRKLELKILNKYDKKKKK